MWALEDFLKFLFSQRLCTKTALWGQRVVILNVLNIEYDRPYLIDGDDFGLPIILLLRIKTGNRQSIYSIDTKNPTTPFVPIPDNLHIVG